MKYNIIFVICGFFLDTILNLLVSNGFSSNAIVFIPCIGLCCLLLICKDLDVVNCFIVSMSFGMMYDFLLAKTNLLYAFLFVILAFIARSWSKHYTETVIEMILLLVSTIFIKEVLLYLFYSIFYGSDVAFETWFVFRVLPTLIFNGILSFIVIYFFHLKDDLLEIKINKDRKKEKILWVKLSSKQ